MIIGLVGPIASGKGEAINILKEAGFAAYSLSEEVREEARRRNLIIKREVLVGVANELRASEPEYFASKIGERILADGPSLVVIDGIRNPAEAIYLKQTLGIVLVALEAPTEIRLDRYLQRSRNDDGRTSEDFYRQDSQDLGRGETQSGQQVAQCLALADLTLKNDRELEIFENRLMSLISQLWYKS